MKKKPSLVSLFSGAGCFDYGFEAAGYDTKLTTDIDFDSCATISISRPKWNNIQSDIYDLKKEVIYDITGLKKFETDLLIGGPPCQPFSKSAYGTLGSVSALNDPRGNLVKEYFRILGNICPKVFIIENVPQFISGPNQSNLKVIKREISKINAENRTNYKLKFQVINTAWYGVPQIRNRLFIIAEREGNEFIWPEITHQEKADKELQIESYLTAGEALKGVKNRKSDLESLVYKGKYASLLRTIPAGMNYIWHSELHGKKHFKSRSRFWNFLLKLSPDLPSWTITAQPGSNIGPFHWENRRLSERELARLQTIPDDVEFFCSTIDSPRKQIGNGVPSLIGEILGNEIKKQLLGHKNFETHLKLLPTRRKKRIGLEFDL